MSSLDERIHAGIREHQARIEPVDQAEFMESVVRGPNAEAGFASDELAVLTVAVGVVIVAAAVSIGLGFTSSSGTHVSAIGRIKPALHDPQAGSGGFTVSPSTGLRNGQSVNINVHGLNPNEHLLVVMCRGVPKSFVASQGQCDLNDARNFTTNGQGAALINFTVRRFLTGAGTSQIDCATYPAGCSVGLGDFYDLQQGGTTGNVQPVTFARGPAAPSTIVSIATDPGPPFTDGEQITVTGKAFPANVPINVAECPYGTECSPLFMTVQSSSGGTFSTKVTLHQTLTVGNQSFDCSRANSCYLLAQTTQQPPNSHTQPTVAPGLPITVSGVPGSG